MECSSVPKEGPPDDQEHGQHEGERIFPDVSNKTRGVDVLLIGDGFDHEVGSVADVGVCAEKDRARADRQDEFAEGGIAEEKTNPDLVQADGSAGQFCAVILLQRSDCFAEYWST